MVHVCCETHVKGDIMFVLEIKRSGEGPAIDVAVEETVEACVGLAVQMMDDGTKKDYAEMAKALRSKRIWKGDGVVITISKGKGGGNV